MSRWFFLGALVLSAGCGGKVIFDTGGTMGAGGFTGTSGSGTSTQSHSSATTNTTGSVITGPAQASPLIACGNNQCNKNSNQECCASPPGAFCVPNGSACMGLAMHCSSNANCLGGELCCTHIANNGSVAQCDAKCTSGPQLCATSNECSNGEICVAGPGGIGFCQPPAPGTSGSGGG